MARKSIIDAMLEDFERLLESDLQKELAADFEKLFTADEKKPAKKNKKKSAKKKTAKRQKLRIRDIDEEEIDDETLDTNNRTGSNVSDYLSDLFDNLGVSPQEQDQYNGTLAKYLNRVKRQYKKVSPKKFFYNKPGDLKKKYKRIQMHILVHSSVTGYSIMGTNRGAKKSLSVGQWANRFNHETKAYGISTYEAITQNLLPAIRNKSGDDWRFISLIGWNGYDDIQQDKNPNKRKGNKTAKKGDSNARNKRRR